VDLSRARAAQRTFATTSLAERSRLLSSLRRSVLKRADALADVLVDELGKVRSEALVLDVAVAATTLSWAAQAAPSALASSSVPSFLPGLPRRATSTWRPRGLCALLSPWNYPLAIPMGTLAAALAGGNGVVWKPSEHAPRASRALLEVLREGGLPPDLVTLVEGGADAGRAVVDADVDHVTFVGSTAVARDVAARCGARRVPCVVEGGGKAPAIVADDADVERAAAAIVFGGLANGGQSCVSVERVYAAASIFDDLFARVQQLSTSLRPGVELGRPVLVERDRLLRQRVKDAGGSGLVVDVTGEGGALVDEECFGAVIPFVKVADDDEAVASSNAHPLQLAAYVFASRRRARAIAARLRAPMVAIDDVMIHYALPDVAFGGAGASGVGRVHGAEGLRALCLEQIVVEPTLPLLAREPWWQPYDRDPKPWLTVLDKTLGLLERLRGRR
jgi:acyl-CoA reductase-like NAD-dependent aldehyde dehydrogenase